MQIESNSPAPFCVTPDVSSVVPSNTAGYSINPADQIADQAVVVPYSAVGGRKSCGMGGSKKKRRSKRGSKRRKNTNRKRKNTNRRNSKKTKIRKSSVSSKKWTDCVRIARKELKIKGFVPIKKGSQLYKKAKEIQNRK